MGIFKKIFKGIGKGFKWIGRQIKKGFAAFGKLINKAGIFGQIGMMILSMYAGPMLWQSLSNSFIGTAVKGLGTAAKGFGTAAKAALKSNKFGKIILDGAAKIANVARGAKRMTIDQLGSVMKGTKDLITSTVKAAGEKLGLQAASTAPLTSVTYTPGTGVSATVGTGKATKAATAAITKAAGGEGLKATAKAIVDNTTEQMAANFWEGTELLNPLRGFQDSTRMQQKEFFQKTIQESSLDTGLKFDSARQSPIDKSLQSPIDKSLLEPKPELSVLESADAATEPSLLKSRATGELTEAQKNFMIDTTKLDLGAFGKQTGFDPTRQSPVASIQHGAQPISKFNLTDAQKKGLQVSTFDTSLRAGIAAASDPIEEALAQGSTIKANTAGIWKEISEQVGIGAPTGTTVPEFNPQFEFVSNHGVDPEVQFGKEYNKFIATAYGNQKFNWATQA